jgi:formylglycine-generating enzyme required for sulfatase activity
LSQGTGRGYTLPTEAQWEYACRGGTESERYWGDDDFTMGRHANVADSWAREILPNFALAETADGFAVTAPVGSFPRNAFGLYDMLGNACEWCRDWYDEDYYKIAARRNPQGPRSGTLHVMRGGSWGSHPADVRAATRLHSISPDGIFDGFRVCRIPSPADKDIAPAGDSNRPK